MSDEAGAAPAAAESLPASDTPPASPPNPISTEGEDPPPAPKAKGEPVAPEPKAKALTTREALEKRFAEQEAAEKGTPPAPVKSDAPAKEPAKAEPKADAKPDQARAADGKFASADKPAAEPAKAPAPEPAPIAAPKPTTPAGDAPARFSADAKAAWAATHEAVRGETQRAIREMEAGIEKHRADAQAFEPVRKYHDMAVQQGTTLGDALNRYVGMENLLRSDPVAGMLAICQNGGINPAALVQAMQGRISGQPTQGDAPEVSSLKAEVAALKQQISGVQNTFKERDTLAMVERFASDHPRLDELSEPITRLMQTGYAKDLTEAYALAERLHPAAAPAPIPAPVVAQPVPAPQTAAIPDLTAQTLKGSKSIAGSPGSGSDPVRGKPSPSISKALERAFAAAG